MCDMFAVANFIHFIAYINRVSIFFIKKTVSVSLSHLIAPEVYLECYSAPVVWFTWRLWLTWSAMLVKHLMYSCEFLISRIQLKHTDKNELICNLVGSKRYPIAIDTYWNQTERKEKKRCHWWRLLSRSIQMQ